MRDVPARRPRARALSARQAAILDDLVELFLTNGFAEYGLGDLADYASCSKSTLYLLAPSKEQLVDRCVDHYFRRAADRVETSVREQRTSIERLRAYLLAVADELGEATATFLDDVAANPMTRRTYERHTQFAADRVRSIVADGIEKGEFEAVHARFVGEVTAAAMDAIERGGITERTGLSHAEAYAELAAFILSGVAVPTARRRRGTL